MDWFFWSDIRILILINRKGITDSNYWFLCRRNSCFSNHQRLKIGSLLEQTTQIMEFSKHVHSFAFLIWKSKYFLTMWDLLSIFSLLRVSHKPEKTQRLYNLRRNQWTYLSIAYGVAAKDVVITEAWEGGYPEIIGNSSRFRLPRCRPRGLVGQELAAL